MPKSSLLRALHTKVTLLLWCLLSVVSAHAQSVHVIYGDNTQNNWQSNPINASVNLSNTAPVKTGTRSMAVASTAGGAMQLSKPVTQVDTTPFQSLSFWVHGGSTGGQKLKVAMLNNGNEGTRWEILPAPQAGVWTKVAIALSDLGVANITTLGGLRIWESNNSATTYYLDDIQLESAAVPSLAGTVYDDFARGNWFSNPFLASVNLKNTAPIQVGAYSMAVTLTSGSGPVQLHRIRGIQHLRLFFDQLLDPWRPDWRAEADGFTQPWRQSWAQPRPASPRGQYLGETNGAPFFIGCGLRHGCDFPLDSRCQHRSRSARLLPR